jgi:hypothetical protein
MLAIPDNDLEQAHFETACKFGWARSGLKHRLKRPVGKSFPIFVPNSVSGVIEMRSGSDNEFWVRTSVPGESDFNINLRLCLSGVLTTIGLVQHYAEITEQRKRDMKVERNVQWRMVNLVQSRWKVTDAICVKNISLRKVCVTENQLKSPLLSDCTIGTFGMNNITRLEPVLAPESSRSAVLDT